MADKLQFKVLVCPFDKSHIIPSGSFLKHLSKCKFSNKKYYRTCKFNNYHVHHLDNIAYHQKTCPDKQNFEFFDDNWGDSIDLAKKQDKQIDEVSQLNSTSSKRQEKSSLMKEKDNNDVGKQQIDNNNIIFEDF